MAITDKLTEYRVSVRNLVLVSLMKAWVKIFPNVKVMSKNFEWVTPDSDLLEKEKTQIKPPSMYNVILNNDDYTPMDFVIEILERFFSLDIDQATQVMLKVHYEGKAICGTFSAEIAETKVAQVTMFAKDNEHPLLCTMEQA